MRIKKLPRILALHLKRFKYFEVFKQYKKLSYRVVFPFELRLLNTVKKSYFSSFRYNSFQIIFSQKIVQIMIVFMILFLLLFTVVLVQIVDII
jgi:hypothetical protein